MASRKGEPYYVSHGSRWRPYGTIHGVIWVKVRSHYDWFLKCEPKDLPYGELRESVENEPATFCKRCFPPEETIV